MGLFGDFKAAGVQRDRLLSLKNDLVFSAEWRRVANSPSFGSGIQLEFATVDCRRCGKIDAGLLLDQTIWDWQSHKVSYSNCIAQLDVWVSESQGPQAPQSKREWLEGQWASYDTRTGVATNMLGKVAVSSKSLDSLEHWIVFDFMSKGYRLKQQLASAIRNSGKKEMIQKLNFHMSEEQLEF